MQIRARYEPSENYVHFSGFKSPTKINKTSKNKKSLTGNCWFSLSRNQKINSKPFFHRDPIRGFRETEYLGKNL